MGIWLQQQGIQDNRRKNLAHMMQGLQQDQLRGLLGLLTGQQDSSSQGILKLFQQNNQQSLQQARQQAMQDTKGLTAAALRDFNNSILPQITGAAEGAGASASALTALLSQNAAAAQAGQVAKLQGAQILGQEDLVNQANMAQQQSLMQLVNTILGASLKQAPAPVMQSGGGRGSSSITPDFSTFFAPRAPLGGFHGSSDSRPLIDGKPYK